MKFEGTQVNIPIKGIMRAGTDNVCADGAMQEVVGMEYKDGSWIPYKEDEQTYAVSYNSTAVTNIVDVYVHKTSDATSHFIFLLSDGKLLYQNGDITVTDNVHHVNTGLLAEGVKDVSFVGNVVCVTTNGESHFYLWQNGEYNESVQLFPEVAIRANAGFVNDNNKIVGVQYCQNIDVVQEEGRNTMNEIAMSAVVSALGGLRDKGGLSGYCFGCYAYRLKNGEIVQASAPFLLGKPMQKHGSYAEGHRYVNINESEEFSLGYNPSTETQPDPIKMFSQFADGGSQLQANHVITPAMRSLDGTIETINYPYYAKEGVSEIKKFDYTVSSTTRSYHGDGEGNAILAWGKAEGETNFRTADKPYLPDMITSLVYQSGYNNEWHGKYFALAAGNGLQFKILTAPDTENNLVDSLCLFLTPEVSPYELRENITDYREMFLSMGGNASNLFRSHLDTSKYYNVYTHYVRRKSETQIIKELMELNSFYLVEEKSLSSLSVDGEWHDVDLTGKLGDQLVVREQLPLSALNKSTYSNSYVSAYNYRLHAYDYKQTLFKGYAWDEMAYNGGLGQYEQSEISGTRLWEIKVELEDEFGKSRVVNYSPEGVTGLPAKLTPVLSYPSLQAKSMTIRCYLPGNYTYKEHSYTLEPIDSLGISVYMDPELKPIDASGGSSVMRYPTSIPEFQETNNVRTFNNGLRVSDVAYPSYFPIAYTYRIGNEKIIGLARLTIPMGQDNFGRNSLIIFCTDGIYSLRVDTSGNGVYTNTDYVSPEVCVNKNSICEIGGAVFFAGDKGLMMLTGDTNGNVQLYAPHLNGQPRFLPATEESKEAHGVYRKMIDNTAILSEGSEGEFITRISSGTHADFADFLKDANTHLVYISIKNKLLAYNNDKEYSYFIDISTGNTTKLSLTSKCDDGEILDKGMWEVKDAQGGLYTVHTLKYLSEEDDAVQSLILTRPIKVQQDDKCSYRVVLTGYFEGLTGNWADLVVMGSLDGDHWRVIGVKEKKLVGGFHNLGALTERGSWKYLMFIFGGKLKENSHIDSVDITVDGRYNNKKR